MKLQITTVIENRPDDNKELSYEHGLSMDVRFDGKHILFDTGQTGAFLKNAKTLGLDFTDLDEVVLSHGHYDHTGGLMQLTDCLDKKRTKIRVGEGFFLPKYKKMDDGTYHYNGNPFTKEQLLETGAEVKEQKTDTEKISDHIWLFRAFTQRNDYERLNPKFLQKRKEEYQLDTFGDEIALGLEDKQGLIVLVGCSHVGIINMLQDISQRTALPIYAVIGGTHLVDADEERIAQTIQFFREKEIQITALSHCTGIQGMEKMREAFGTHFVDNHTGSRIEKE